MYNDAASTHAGDDLAFDERRFLEGLAEIAALPESDLDESFGSDQLDLIEKLIQQLPTPLPDRWLAAAWATAHRIIQEDWRAAALALLAFHAHTERQDDLYQVVFDLLRTTPDAALPLGYIVFAALPERLMDSARALALALPDESERRHVLEIIDDHPISEESHTSMPTHRMHLITQRFSIACEQQAAAFDALIDHNPLWQADFGSLEEVMAARNWPLTLDSTGNIIGITFDDEHLSGHELRMFAALAPFVTAGSFILGLLGGSELICWSFDGARVREQRGEVLAQQLAHILSAALLAGQAIATPLADALEARFEALHAPMVSLADQGPEGCACEVPACAHRQARALTDSRNDEDRLLEQVRDLERRASGRRLYARAWAPDLLDRSIAPAGYIAHPQENQLSDMVLDAHLARAIQLGLVEPGSEEVVLDFQDHFESLGYVVLSCAADGEHFIAALDAH